MLHQVLDLLRRAQVRRHDCLVRPASRFWSRGGQQKNLTPALAAAPLHSTPSFLAAKALHLRDKLAIARAIAIFLKGAGRKTTGTTFADWLRTTGQTRRASGAFLETGIFSALNEDPDRISLRYAAKVFREAFFSPQKRGEWGFHVCR